MEVRIIMDEDLIFPGIIVFVFSVFLGLYAVIDSGVNMYLEYVWWLVGITVVLSEFSFFAFDDEKPKKNDSRFWFTVKRKLTYIVPTGFVVFLISGPVFFAAVNIPKVDWTPILNFIGWGTLVVIIFLVMSYAFIKLNSLKYRNVKYPKPKRKAVKK